MPPTTSRPEVAPTAGTAASTGASAPAFPSTSAPVLARLPAVGVLSCGPQTTLAFRRVGDELGDVCDSVAELAMVEQVLAEANTVRTGLLAVPGGFSERRPIVVDWHLHDGVVVVDWVPGDYAVSCGISRYAARLWLRDPGAVVTSSWLGLGAMGLNAVIRTSDARTLVAVRSSAADGPGGLAHVPMNEGLNAVDVPDAPVGAVVPFDAVSASRRGVFEELGTVLGERVPVRVDAVFEVRGHGLGVSVSIDWTGLWVTAADVLECAEDAVDGWEWESLRSFELHEAPPSVGQVLAAPDRYSTELGASVGALSATPWAALCFAAAGLWPSWA